MSPRNLGITLVLYAAVSSVLRWLSLNVPIFKIPFLGGAWFGWIFLALTLLVGTRLVLKRQWNFTPLMVKQFKRFKAIRRGYISFLILVTLVGLGALDDFIVGKRALMVSYHGELYFPFATGVLPETTFGGTEASETDYRELKKRFAEEKSSNWVLMPLIPYDAKLDTPEIVIELNTKDGVVYAPDASAPFSGRAYTVFKDHPEAKRQEWVYRHGIRNGEMRGWDVAQEQVEKATFKEGAETNYKDYTDGKAAALQSQAGDKLFSVVYPPVAPTTQNRLYLGSTSAGGNVLSILYGGWQQIIIAAILYVSFIFVTGILIGGALGYFGGTVDLVGSRLIEIWSVLPFLFVVMIISSIISPTFVLLIVIISIFSWIGTALYIRTATYREKARDYVAAARLQGAGTVRILFRHILPNSISLLVTLAPFEVAAIIYSLAALDFLGFGLPPEEPSWGRLLHEGTENFNYPWIVSSAFVAMTTVLVLVTFVGEAVREAFDPKKFTNYK